MEQHKLAILARDPAVTGFHYQQLKVLEEWLLNRLEAPQDVLYINEVSINNPGVYPVKFSQVNYYAANSSFNSGEVNKAIARFFNLWMNGAYKVGETYFVFWTNASIVKDEERVEIVYEGNASSLLKEWVENQDQLNDDLLARVVGYLTEVIDQSGYPALPHEDWQAFARSVRWEFAGISDKEGMAVLVEGIDDLIRHLPLEGIKTQAALLRAALYFEITERAKFDNVDEQALTSDLLDHIVMNAGAGDAKWYRHALEVWKGQTTITHFDPGQLYEVVTAARYCRFRSLRASGEHEQWQDLLHAYIHLEDAPIYYLRKAIYEYLFLITATDPDSFLPGGTLAGMEDGINYYFDNTLPPIRDIEMEEDIALLSLVINAQSTGQINIEVQLIEFWKGNIMSYLDSRFEESFNVNTKCVVLELKGALIMDCSTTGDYDEAIKQAVSVYSQILPLLPQARTYNMKRLLEILDALKRTMILLGVKGEGARYLEKFLDEIGK